MPFFRELTVLLAVVALCSCASSSSESTLRAAVESNGDGGWSTISIGSEPDLVPAIDVETLVVVTGTEYVFDQVLVPSATTTFGRCDAACERAVADAVGDHPSARELPAILSGICWNCEVEEFLSLLAVEEGEVRALGREDILDALAPIDTAFEALLVYGRTDLIRSRDDGWEVIRSGVSDCTPFDRTHTLSFLSLDGEIIELASYVEPADSDEDEVCA